MHSFIMTGNHNKIALVHCAAFCGKVNLKKNIKRRKYGEINNIAPTWAAKRGACGGFSPSPQHSEDKFLRFWNQFFGWMFYQTISTILYFFQITSCYLAPQDTNLKVINIYSWFLTLISWLTRAAIRAFSYFESYKVVLLK